MNRETVETIMELDQFKKQTTILLKNRLAFDTSYTREIARQDLIGEVLIRLKNWDDIRVYEAILHDESLDELRATEPDPIKRKEIKPEIFGLIKYARLDVAKKYSKSEIALKNAKESIIQEGLATDIKMGAVDEYSIAKTSEIEEAEMIINAIFRNHRTREWMLSVITVGREETMARFEQSSRSFTKKMSDVKKVLAENEDVIRDVRRQYENGELQAELNELNELADAMADEDADDETVQNWIDEHEAEANDMVSSPEVKNEARLVFNFAAGEQIEKYAFINNVYSRIDWLKKKLRENSA